MFDHADLPDSDRAVIPPEHQAVLDEPAKCFWANGVHPGGIAPEHCPCTFPGNQVENQTWKGWYG